MVHISDHNYSGIWRHGSTECSLQNHYCWPYDGGNRYPRPTYSHLAEETTYGRPSMWYKSKKSLFILSTFLIWKTHYALYPIKSGWKFICYLYSLLWKSFNTQHNISFVTYTVHLTLYVNDALALHRKLHGW